VLSSIGPPGYRHVGAPSPPARITISPIKEETQERIRRMLLDERSEHFCSAAGDELEAPQESKTSTARLVHPARSRAAFRPGPDGNSSREVNSSELNVLVIRREVARRAAIAETVAPAKCDQGVA